MFHYEGQYVANPGNQGISVYTWQTLGNVVNLFTSMVWFFFIFQFFYFYFLCVVFLYFFYYLFFFICYFSYFNFSYNQVAAAMYGNVGLKVLYICVAHEMFGAPSLDTKKGILIVFVPTPFWLFHIFRMEKLFCNSSVEIFLSKHHHNHHYCGSYHQQRCIYLVYYGCAFLCWIIILMPSDMD